MTYLAAVERSGDNGPETLALMIAAGVVIYAAVCFVWPWKRCRGEWWWGRACDGGRVYQSKRRDAFRHCRRCKGTAKQRRLGRTVWAVLVKTWRRAKVHR